MMNNEFVLPDDIIHLIQSFLTGKEAAQTITLSKSWHRAWLTRPNLDFDESDYFTDMFDYEEHRRSVDEILALAKKTIQRYEDSNLKIESFRLSINHFYEHCNLANKLIVKAMKLGASLVSFEIKDQCNTEAFVISPEVFESESLLGLSVKGLCKINIGKNHIVRCYNLVSLSLSSVEIGSDVISNIISNCPMIRNLSLSDLICPMIRNSSNAPIKLPKLHNLKCLMVSGVHLPVEEYTIDVGTKLESLSLDSLSIETQMIHRLVLSCPLIKNVFLSNIFQNQYPINLPKLHNLKSLTLICVRLDSLLLDDLSSKFPTLKYLTLDGVYRSDQDEEEEEEEMRISSRSLERLNLTPKYSTSMFKFDVPSIKKFVIEACFIPSVSFESTSEEWESHVSLNIQDSNPRYNETESVDDVSINMGDCNPCSNAWFLALNELLTALSPSNINLSVKGSCDTCFDYEARDIQGLPQPRVENLTVDIQSLRSLNCYALFDGLFRNCRPQLITQYQYLNPDKLDPGRYINDFLLKRLERGMNGDFSSPESFMYGLHDLKEVFVQFLDDDDFVAVRPWIPLAEASEITLKPKRKIGFQLVWKS